MKKLFKEILLIIVIAIGILFINSTEVWAESYNNYGNIANTTTCTYISNQSLKSSTGGTWAEWEAWYPTKGYTVTGYSGKLTITIRRYTSSTNFSVLTNAEAYWIYLSGGNQALLYKDPSDGLYYCNYNSWFSLIENIDGTNREVWYYSRSETGVVYKNTWLYTRIHNYDPTGDHGYFAFDEHGHMCTGWHKTGDGKWFYFKIDTSTSEDGACIKVGENKVDNIDRGLKWAAYDAGGGQNWGRYYYVGVNTYTHIYVRDTSGTYIERGNILNTYSESQVVPGVSNVLNTTVTNASIINNYITTGLYRDDNVPGTFIEQDISPQNGDYRTIYVNEYHVYINRNQHWQTVYVRYQNADGSWGSYGAVINGNYYYESNCAWSRAADDTYNAASISYTVTGPDTKYIDVSRKQYWQTVYVRYQNADGNWGDYGAAVNTNYYYGSTCSWSRAADSRYQAASISYTVTCADTKYVDVYRQTYHQIINVRYQNADGTWGAYSAAVDGYYRYESTCSWSRAADAPHQAASISYVVYGENTKYVDVYRNTHTVTLNKGTGIASVSGAGTYYYGQQATISASLLTGYKWVNWTGSATYPNKTTTFTVYGNRTFTANGEPITYTIKFNGNGNWNTSQGSYTQTCTYDTAVALLDNKFTRADATTYNHIYYDKGYEFVGWGKTESQKTPTYTNKQIIKNLSATDGATVNLYAIWKKDIALTIDFNGGEFDNDRASKVLSYTMYNSELNHTFDITPYYGTLIGTDYNSKGLNNNLTKLDSDGIEYRFLGFSLNQDATVPDTQFDVYSSTRVNQYNIKDNTILYAVWEPVLQMTAQVSAPSHFGEVQLINDVSVSTALGNFTIVKGTKNTNLYSSGTASVNSATVGVNVKNEDLVQYTISAKGSSNIIFNTAADSRIIDIYSYGSNNTWFDELNKVKDFNYSIDNFTSTTGSFIIPKYLGTTQSYRTSNPDLVTNTSIYGIKFTCTQPSYYYNKYWKSDENTSIYCIVFLDTMKTGSGKSDDLPLIPTEEGKYNFQTILN